MIAQGTGFALRRLLRLTGLLWSCCNPPPHGSQYSLGVEVEVTLRLTVSQSVCLGVELTLELVTRCYFLLKGWTESLRTRNPIWLSHLRLLQPGGLGSRIYIPRNRMAHLYPRALSSFYVAFYDSQGYDGDILTLFHTSLCLLCITRRRSYIANDGQSASSSWCQAPLGTDDQILISLSDNYFISSSCKAPSLRRSQQKTQSLTTVASRIAWKCDQPLLQSIGLVLVLLLNFPWEQP
jgi:hypothetical protein